VKKMKIGKYSFEEYLCQLQSFHGNLAPGLVVGGFMVELALKSFPQGELFNAICETSMCLPDALQLLTSSTVGNGRITVLNFGRFAIALYGIGSGKGVRVYLDSSKLERYPEIKSWFLKLKTKQEQNRELLLSQMKEAGERILSVQRIRVEPAPLKRGRMGPVAVCPVCGEAYPVRSGNACSACQGESPYLEVGAYGS
jgi:formylmethanofuran dehydrogenase subunit E